MCLVKVISKGGFMYGNDYHESGSTFNMPCERLPLYQGILAPVEPIEPLNQGGAIQTTKKAKGYNNKMLKMGKNKDCSNC